MLTAAQIPAQAPVPANKSIYGNPTGANGRANPA